MACQEQAYQSYLAEQQATNDAFAEFDTALEQDEFTFKTMTIWQELLLIVPLFDYVELKHNHHNGYVMGVDWQAVDILLRRENVKVKPSTFADWRTALSGYIEAINENREKTTEK